MLIHLPIKIHTKSIIIFRKIIFDDLSMMIRIVIIFRLFFFVLSLSACFVNILKGRMNEQSINTHECKKSGYTKEYTKENYVMCSHIKKLGKRSSLSTVRNGLNDAWTSARESTYEHYGTDPIEIRTTTAAAPRSTTSSAHTTHVPARPESQSVV